MSSSVYTYKFKKVINKHHSLSKYSIKEKVLQKRDLNTLSTHQLNLAFEFDSQLLFSIIAEQPWSIWLDSSESVHSNSRYDIMVWQPEITLTTTNKKTTITNTANNQIESSYIDPLTLLQQYQCSFFSNIQINKNNLPFNGGSLGYFAYDLGKHYENTPQLSKKDINIPDMAVGIYHQAIIFDKQSNVYWLLCLDNNREKICHFFNQQLALKNQINNSFKLTSSWQSNMSTAQYHEKFDQVKQYLIDGDCYQINLAQRFNASYQGDEFQAYCALRKENKAPFSAFLRFEHSSILSISPERFLQLNDHIVQTKPIKGTRPRSNDALIDFNNAQALKNSIKDRAENVMIVDLLRNDISRVCKAGTVQVPELFAIESFAAVHHLVSTVEGELSPENNATDLLRACFPGGSITGTPKVRAMEIIESLEPHSRSVYCGSIGYISTCGRMDTNIAIRTLVCHKQKIYCWAGGGLVVDSNVDNEYQETYDKVEKILPVLSHLNLG